MISASRSQEGGFTLLAQGFFEGQAVTVSKPDGSFELRGADDGATWMHVMAEGYASANVQIDAIEDGEVYSYNNPKGIFAKGIFGNKRKRGPTNLWFAQRETI